MADGKVIIEIDGDTKDFEKSLSGLGGIAQKALGAVTTAVAGIGTAFAVAGAKSLGIASNLQEVQNVVDVTFGEGAKQIEAFADTAGEAFGLSELQAKQFSSTIGSITKSMGLTEEKTLETSKALTGLVGDLASFKNLEIEEAFEKIRSGLVGESEPLLAIGVDVRVEALEEYASKLGLVYSELNSTEKLELRIKAILAGNADAMGDYVRTQEGYANTLRTTNTELQEVGATFGGYLLPIATEALGGVQEAIKTLGTELESPKIAGAIETIGAGFSSMFTGLVSSVTQAIPNILQGFAKFVDFVGVAKDTIQVFISEVQAFFTEIFERVSGSELQGSIDNIVSFFSKAFNTISEVVETVFSAIEGQFLEFQQNSGDIIFEAVSFIITSFDLLIQNIETVGLVLSVVGGAFLTYQAYILATSTAVGILAKGQALLNAVMAINPFVAILSTVGALVGALIYLYNTNDKVKVGMQLAWEYIKLGIYKSIDTILGAFDKLISGFNVVLSKVGLGTFGEIGGLDSTKETEANIERLKQQYSELGESADKAKEEIEALNEATRGVEVPPVTTSGAVGGTPTTSPYTYFETGFVGPLLPQETLPSDVKEEAEKTGGLISESIKQGIEDTGYSIGDTIGGTLENAINGEYQNIEQAGKDIGKNLLLGLGQGISDTTQSIITGAIQMSIKSILGAFTGGFGIASPSKVFAEMGMWNMQGLANGMTDNVSFVDKSLGKVQSLVSGITPSFDYSGLQAQASYMPQLAMSGANYMPNITITNINNAPNTEVQTTKSVDSKGNVEIQNIVISLVADDIYSGGQIPQALSAVSNKTQTR